MNVTYSILLAIHIISGTTCLIFGFGAMISRKGSNPHKKSGRIFYFSMMAVVCTAIAMSIIKYNEFLLTIGIFSFYQMYSGRRAIRNKSLKASTVDLFVLIIAVLNGIYMVASLHLILMIFGTISLFLSFGQTVRFRQAQTGKALPKKAWLAQHIGMMTGAYIATVTAFLVANTSGIGNAWIIWFSPTILLVPFIVYWTRKFAS